MDINQLEVLVVVAREKSFSRAAEVLQRTQPAVSQAIRRLEQDVGEKLFDRSSKDGTLTYAGELLVDYARQMLNLRQTAQTAIKEMRNLHSGKVTLSANEHTVFYLLPIIAEYRKRHPHIKIEVHRGVASRIPKEITAREVELGIVSFKPVDDTLRSISVLNDQLLLIVSPEHRLAGKTSVSIRELAEETFIAHNAVSPYRRLVVETFEKNNTPLNISVELPSLEAIKRLVQAGVGIAMVPKLGTRAEIADGRLIGLTVSELKLERKLHIIYRRRSVLSHAAQEFIKIAKEMSADGQA
ncbi:MAG: LysR family transcriptional regulator [Acidobacteria bacterium]|nr:LysR family transcriptional regulator [Acidobacteriota bacterium]